MKWVVCVIFLLTGCAGAIAEDNNAGNRLYRNENYTAALREYQSAQVNAPDRPEAYYNAASALAGQGNYEMAVAALEQALRVDDPDLLFRAYYNLGNVHFRAMQFNRAITAYQEALLINPDDDDARYNLELALQRAVAPTPTAIEQQTEPENDETDPDVTPTNNPGGFDGPTPTPPPQDAPPDPEQTPESGDVANEGVDSATPIPAAEGEMTIEQAERILDSVQQDQQTLTQFLQEESNFGIPAEKDW